MGRAREKEIIREVARRTGMKQNDVQKVVNEFFLVAREILMGGDAVAVPGFGTFRPHTRPGREMKIPFGGMVQVPPKKTVILRLCKNLLEAMKDMEEKK